MIRRWDSHGYDMVVRQESLYQAALTATILQWNRLSDYTGRKPVLLIGIFGSMVSTLLFGLSRTFWGLVAR